MTAGLLPRLTLLVPGVGEIVGGSQREERDDMLRKRIEELGLDMSQYDWYMELRRFGGVKHAGYGLGFERMVMYVTGIANIRDVLPLPAHCGQHGYIIRYNRKNRAALNVPATWSGPDYFLINLLKRAFQARGCYQAAQAHRLAQGLSWGLLQQSSFLRAL